MASKRNGIQTADLMSDGLLVGFEDGRYAIYSAELLLSIFSQAKEIVRDEDDDQPLSFRPE